MNTLSWRKDLKLNDVEVKTLSWRKDLKLNAARCSSGTHATVRFTRGNIQRNIRDKRFPREACFFSLGNDKVDETHCELQ